MSPRCRHSLAAVACLIGLGAAPAWAQEADFGSFEDVGFDHWAFLTVETLVRKYQVMAGFPDGTFGGDRPVSRYELAAALNKVIDRMNAKFPGKMAPKTDVEAVKSVAANLNLTGLADRIAKLESDLDKANTVGPAAVSLSGSIGSTWMDNTQDTINPYLKAGVGLDANATVNNFEVYAGMYGDLPGTTVGNQPGTAGGGKPPDNTNFHLGGAYVTTTIADTKLRVGTFAPGEFYGSGAGIATRWDGIVGNGMLGAGVNSVRWWDGNAAIAANRAFGPVTVAVATTPSVVLGGLSAQITDWLLFKVGADTDQPDWWGVTPNRTNATNLTTSLLVGTDPLAFSFQGNAILGVTPLYRMAGQFTWAIIGDVRLSVGAVYKESDKSVTEVTPGVSLYFPSFLPPYMPSVNLGVKEPQVVWAADTKVLPGPGSLLGEQAGVSALFEWPLGDGLPNVRAEYNIQQPVLFYSIYDATFAFEVSKGF